MKWICVQGTHINTSRIDTFFWRDSRLWIWFAGAMEAVTWDDPYRESYLQVCHQLGVRPDEEVVADGEK